MNQKEKTQQRALLLTVGTGNAEQLQETLLTPLAKSIRDGEWSKIVLLPSKFTEDNANAVLAMIGELPIELQPLSEQGMEDDPDACFDHFDRVIGSLIAAGYPADQIVVDITRGTKTMSAALAMAAVRHGVPQLRYITGRRDQRGMVIPETEVIRQFSTVQVEARRDADLALHMIRHGHFAAAMDVLPDPAKPFSRFLPAWLLGRAAQLRALALFYGAWDRFDYHCAKQVDLTSLAEADDKIARLCPSQQATEWVRLLDEPVPGKITKDDLEPLEIRLVDLLANARRRWVQEQYEDALIRLYRICELIGRVRVVTVTNQTIKTNDKEMTLYNTIHTLKAKKDHQFAEPLKQLSKQNPLGTSHRNRSILIHGYTAKASAKHEAIEPIINQLTDLLKLHLGDTRFTVMNEAAQSVPV